MKNIYVDGEPMCMKEAIAQTGGNYNSLRKAVNCGLNYRGHFISEFPPDDSKVLILHPRGSGPLLPKVKVHP